VLFRLPLEKDVAMVSDQSKGELLPIYEWCKQQRERSAERLKDLESGTWRIGQLVDGKMVDETAQAIEISKREIAQMDELIAMYEKESGKPQ
jgi:uncharacterized protein YktB (UPF0637 family)